MANRNSAAARAGADKSGSAGVSSQAGDRSDLAGGEEAVLEKIREAMQGIEFGSVLIKIHQGEVVGIESTRKARLRGAPGEPS
jgi:hypothetical protein